MTGNLTTYGANAVLSGSAMPTGWYVKGHVGNPGPDALLNPAAETRRLLVNMDSPVSGSCENDNLVTISSAAATEVFTHVSLWDDPTTGNPWWVIEIGTPSPIVAGNTIRLLAGLLTTSFVIWS